MSFHEDLKELGESRTYDLAELNELIKTSPKPWMFLRRCGLFHLMGEKECAYEDIETAWENFKSWKNTKVKGRVLKSRSDVYKSYKDLPRLRDAYESQFANYKAMPQCQRDEDPAFREFLGNYGGLLVKMNVEQEKAYILIRQAISLYGDEKHPKILDKYLEGLKDVHELAETKRLALEKEPLNPPPDTQKKKNKKKKEKTVSKSAENSSDVMKEIISSNVGETSEASISTTRIISSNVADYENRKTVHGRIEYYCSYKKDVSCGVHAAELSMRSWVDGKDGMKTISCSFLDFSSEDTAHYNSLVAKCLGDHAVTVHLVHEGSVILDEVECDLRGWYTRVCNSLTAEDESSWLTFIEDDVKKIFSGIFKSLTLLYHSNVHGNWINGISIGKGTLNGKVYNMKLVSECWSYLDDFDDLFKIVLAVLKRKQFKGCDDKDGESSEPCSPRFIGSSLGLEFYSEKLRQSLTLLNDGIQGKAKSLFLYVPFFWEYKERNQFLESMHSVLFLRPKNEKFRSLLNLQFERSWHWRPFVKSPEFVKVLNEISDHRRVASVLLWRNCKHHAHKHDNVFQTAEEIDNRLDKEVNICTNVFIAVWSFISLDLKDLREADREIASDLIGHLTRILNEVDKNWTSIPG